MTCTVAFNRSITSPANGSVGVATVDQHTLHRLQILLAPVHDCQGTVAVRYIGRGHGKGVGQALRVHSNMSPDSKEMRPKIAAIFSIAESCRKLDVFARQYLTDVLPGLADRFIQSLAELTATAYAAKMAN